MRKHLVRLDIWKACGPPSGHLFTKDGAIRGVWARDRWVERWSRGYLARAVADSGSFLVRF